MKTGRARIDYLYLAGAKKYTIHLVADKLRMYAWADGNSNGVIGTLQQYAKTVVAPRFDNLRCSPWWLPDESYFLNADGVTVSEAPLPR